MSSNKETLRKIKSGVLSRGLALAKVSVSAGARVASHTVGNIFASEEDKPERLKELLMSQVGHLTQELGQLKGSVMKVGQMLSMYGEQFLPPEVNALLKSLQNQSPPLAWSEIKKVIEAQIPAEKLAEVEIDPVPMASASLGQVHKARRKSDGRWLAMKVQYPGVDKAIEGDLKALKSILSLSKMIPKGPKYEEIFDEIRIMLHQEVDYSQELETTCEFKEKIAGDSRFVIPDVVRELSTKRILTTTLEEGVPVDGPEVLGLPQERRNQIGINFLSLYLRELFELRAVQTDPHFGNYRIRLGKDGASDQIVLLDFGAVRKLAGRFLDPYLEMVKGTHARNPSQIVRGATAIGLLREGDPEELVKLFIEICYMIAEPFFPYGVSTAPAELYDADGNYLWGESDLPKRLAKKGSQLAMSFKLRTPPRELVFLDRKLGGVFIFLSVLKVRIKANEVFKPYLNSGAGSG